MIIDLQHLSVALRQHYLQHAIAPRPICFASTISKEGQVNLSPFSFFNLFSLNPPIIIFSPSRRGRDNTTKHTLQNMLEVPEVCVNMVDYGMVRQASLSSCEFPRDVNEFVKAGFTEEAATHIKPPLVKESKIKMECRVVEIKSLGTQGGAGNLAICEVLCMHLDEQILDRYQHIDQQKLHLVARLGGNWYCRVDPSNLFEVEKPNTELGIGVDALFPSIRNSRILTGNHLGQLGNVHAIPDIDASFQDERLKNIFQYYSTDPEEMEKELHVYAKELLDKGLVKEAWQVLLAG